MSGAPGAECAEDPGVNPKRFTSSLTPRCVGHGLGWDSWHYRNSPYIADWYSSGCLLVDITIGAYAAVLFSRTAES
jgi:hypothetical protein